MEPLLKQLRGFPKKFAAWPAATRWLVGGGIVVLGLVAVLLARLGDGGGGYQYAFTNLTPEDASQAAGMLMAAGIPFRPEANGAALAIPSRQVPEARLVLAAAGLPRGGGVAFKLFDRELESRLEQRVVELLEPAVGHGAVIAKVTATIDSSEVESTQDRYDPDTTAVRSARKVTDLTVRDGSSGAGTARAPANHPLALAPPAPGAARGARTQSTHEDALENFEVNKIVTRTVTRSPRIVRLSAAILVDGVDGKPLSPTHLARLTELAKRGVGFDEARGDKLAIASEPFIHGTGRSVAEPPPWARPEALQALGYGSLALVAAALAVALLRRPPSAQGPVALLGPGARVGDVQAARAVEGGGSDGALTDVNAVRERARELTKADPSRAAHLLRAWISSDTEKAEGRRG